MERKKSCRNSLGKNAKKKKKRRVSGTLAGIWCAPKTFALRVSLLVLGPEKGLLASNEAAMQSAV